MILSIFGRRGQIQILCCTKIKVGNEKRVLRNLIQREERETERERGDHKFSSNFGYLTRGKFGLKLWGV